MKKSFNLEIKKLRKNILNKKPRINIPSINNTRTNKKKIFKQNIRKKGINQ